VTDHPPLTDAQISREWGAISARADELVSRRQAAPLRPVEHGSQLQQRVRRGPRREPDSPIERQNLSGRTLDERQISLAGQIGACTTR
jgi:hypothetical protein